MIGSAFISHNGTWSCSNDCIYSETSTPIFENDKVVATKRGYQLSVNGLFAANTTPIPGDKCQIVFKTDDKNEKYGFVGEFYSITKIQTIITIFAKTDKISEILSNITFKN